MIYKLGTINDLMSLPSINPNARKIIENDLTILVQQRLGHADIQITLNTYTHVLPEMDIDAADKLDSVLLKRA